MFGVKKSYPNGMSASEYNQINARFNTYDRSKNQVVVGCVGSLWAEDLNRTQIAYIRNFCAAVGGVWKHEIVDDWPSKWFPRANFNNFIVFTKVTDHKVFHPDYFTYSNDVVEPCLHCGRLIPIKIDKDSINDLEIECPVCREAMSICSVCDLRGNGCDPRIHKCKKNHMSNRKEHD